MIFVAVGTTLQGFDRLMKAVEEMRKSGQLKGEVIVQHGHSSVVPAGCRSVPFVGREEFDRLIRDASLVITHAGAGAVGKCLLAGKKPVVVPRLKLYGEHVNDHQIELVRELDTRGRIYAVYDLDRLAEVVRTALEQGGNQPSSSGGSRVARIIGDYLDGIAGLS
ncbi:MAG: PssE/Cps14G family polysaccharide biosynthesis glycosyltransferase [Deltaproteobacteria bacterium]